METDSRAVSPVVSVILTVAITILLAAVVSAFVLSLGDGTSEEGPSVSLSVEQEGDQLMVTHAAGDTINTSDLRLTGMKGWGPSAQEFTGGDRISGTPAPGTDRVDIVFQTEDSSSILRTVDVSNMEVSSLVVNDGFERGSGKEADDWTEKGAETKIERTDERSLSGDYSMKFSGLTSNYGSRTIISEPVSVTGGQEYRFGGSYNIIEASGVKYKAALRVIWTKSQGGETEDKSFKKLDGNSWNKVETSKEAPNNAISARLNIQTKEFSQDNPNVYWENTFIKPAN
jgi:flagellin-like protein